MLDPDLPVHPVEGEREDPRAQQDEQHEGRQARRRRQRVTHDGEGQTLLHRRQHQRTDRTHCAAFGGRRDAEEDRAQHEEDQRQRRDQHDHHLLGQTAHQVGFQRLVQQRHDIDRDHGHTGCEDLGVVDARPARLEILLGEDEDRDRTGQRHQERHHARAQRARLFRQSRHRLRLDDRHHEHIAEVDAGQHHTGDQRALVHVAHRNAQLVSQNDQHERGRDDLRQCP